jgi:hypothetical protein
MNPLLAKYLIGGIGIALAIAALVGLIYSRNHWKTKAADRQAQIVLICNAARDAANNPKMDCGDTAKQIALLGGSLHATRAALDRQNVEVTALEQKTASQQADAVKASRIAQERVSAAQGVSAHLIANSRSTAQKTGRTGLCEPSDAVKETWR